MDNKIITRDKANLGKLLGLIAEALIDRGIRIVTAESCTGGSIASAIVSIPGSSSWFEGSFVAYSNKAKQSMLGVDPTLFMPDQAGAVSQEVVKQMVVGAIEASNADIGLSVSGIAGPGGGTKDKPVGTVWIAWKHGENERSDRFLFSGDRNKVRDSTVIAALAGVLDILKLCKTS
jgi:nicotinamide-nucleotide amidase